MYKFITYETKFGLRGLMRFNANQLFIQCDNAVFSAEQIRAKTIEMIVSGELTLESLRDTFMSESNLDK